MAIVSIDHCPLCEAVLVHKNGKFGPFMCCSTWPSCNWNHSRIRPAKEPWAFLLGKDDWPERTRTWTKYVLELQKKAEGANE